MRCAPVGLSNSIFTVRAEPWKVKALPTSHLDVGSQILKCELFRKRPRNHARLRCSATFMSCLGLSLIRKVSSHDLRLKNDSSVCFRHVNLQDNNASLGIEAEFGFHQLKYPIWMKRYISRFWTYRLCPKSPQVHQSLKKAGKLCSIDQWKSYLPTLTHRVKGADASQH